MGARHMDKGNIGPSALRSVGDSSGGQLRYWNKKYPLNHDLSRLPEHESILLDPKHGLILFDGNRPHSVEPYRGERFSVVFFTTSWYGKTSPDTRTELNNLGAISPTNSKIAAAQRLVNAGA